MAAIPGYYCYNNPNPNPNLTLTLTLTPCRIPGMTALRNGGPSPSGQRSPT